MIRLAFLSFLHPNFLSFLFVGEKAGGSEKKDKDKIGRLSWSLLLAPLLRRGRWENSYLLSLISSLSPVGYGLRRRQTGAGSVCISFSPFRQKVFFCWEGGGRVTNSPPGPGRVSTFLLLDSDSSYVLVRDTVGEIEVVRQMDFLLHQKIIRCCLSYPLYYSYQGF